MQLILHITAHHYAFLHRTHTSNAVWLWFVADFLTKSLLVFTYQGTSLKPKNWQSTWGSSPRVQGQSLPLEIGTKGSVEKLQWSSLRWGWPAYLYPCGAAMLSAFVLLRNFLPSSLLTQPSIVEDLNDVLAVRTDLASGKNDYTSC